MADFVKKTWACDDIITADELNRMENGIANALESSGTLLFTATERMATAEECSGRGTVYIYSHSWQELYDALRRGQNVMFVGEEEEQGITGLRVGQVERLAYHPDDSPSYSVVFSGSVGSFDFSTPTSKTYVKCAGGGAD